MARQRCDAQPALQLDPNRDSNRPGLSSPGADVALPWSDRTTDPKSQAAQENVRLRGLLVSLVLLALVGCSTSPTPTTTPTPSSTSTPRCPAEQDSVDVRS